MEYVGVDLIEDWKGKLRVLELNRMAQFKGFEKTMGVNVAKKTVEYMLTQV